MTLRLGNRSASGGDSQGCGCGGPRNVCDNRRITAIVRDKDTVMVMFDDCTFMKAPFDVVADNVKRTVTGDGTDLTPLLDRLDALEAKQDKDTVYDDAGLVARIAALEAREDRDTVYDDTGLAGRVTALEEFKQCLCDGLHPVNRLNGQEGFLAIKKDFACCGAVAPDNGWGSPAGQPQPEPDPDNGRFVSSED